tara:strand:- start:2779 stop:3108 length:330 start_codon:yes stop_codon:yes gene_type:complete
MLTRRDLDSLANRIERLQRLRTSDWDSSDALTLRNHLPGGRGQRVLPTPASLREMHPKDAVQGWRTWITWTLNCEGLISRNREPQRTIRDLRRGRVNSRTLPFLTGRRR